MCGGSGGSKGWGLISGVKEVVVVRITTQGTAQLNREFRNMHVKESLIRAIQWCARPKGWRHEGEPPAMELQGGTVGRVQPFDFVVGVWEGLCDNKGSAAVKAQFANSFGAGIALDLDLSRDNVTNFEGNQVAGGVGAVGSIESSLFGEETEDFCGKD